MVGGDFQKPMQSLIAYGYCVFEDDLCVDLSGASYGRPTFANITFSELFVGPCVDSSEVMDEGPDYAATPFFQSFVLGLCAPCVGAFWGCDNRGEKLRGKEISSGLMHILFCLSFSPLPLPFLFTSSISSFFFILAFSDSPFLIVSSLVLLS